MASNKFSMPVPSSILIFGAADHIGRPLTEFLTREAPSTKLRLVTSKESKMKDLQASFPKAEVVRADYNDAATLRTAVAGMQGVFLLTPSGLSEEKPMTDLVAALKEAGCATHIIRVVGLFPEFPAGMARAEGLESGHLEIEHKIAQRILNESGLPVTYINCGATFMDNLRGHMMVVKKTGKVVCPERLVPWLDPRDIGEVAGRLFLSGNRKHIGAFHTMNNGHDLIDFRQLADIISDVTGKPVGYDSSYEAWKACNTQFMGPQLVEILWKFFAWENSHDVIWALNDFVERTLGRKPITVRDWLEEHKHEF